MLLVCEAGSFSLLLSRSWPAGSAEGASAGAAGGAGGDVSHSQLLPQPTDLLRIWQTLESLSTELKFGQLLSASAAGGSGVALASASRRHVRCLAVLMMSSALSAAAAPSAAVTPQTTPAASLASDSGISELDARVKQCVAALADVAEAGYRDQPSAAEASTATEQSPARFHDASLAELERIAMAFVGAEL